MVSIIKTNFKGCDRLEKCPHQTVNLFWLYPSLYCNSYVGLGCIASVRLSDIVEKMTMSSFAPVNSDTVWYILLCRKSKQVLLLHSSCPLKLNSPYPHVSILAWIYSLESEAVKRALPQWLLLESRISMRQETLAFSLPNALHNFWTSWTILVNMKLRWRLQMYRTLHICESWQENWRPVWVSHWGAGRQFWISFLRSSS